MLSSFFSIAAFCYGMILLGMFAFQRRLMYVPETAIYPPEHYGVPEANIIPLTADDGTKIEAWYVPPDAPLPDAPSPDAPSSQAALPCIVYFHGNAGHVGDRMEKIRQFTLAGFPVLALSYRGYGNSKGAPTEEGLYMDARSALACAQHQLGYGLRHILLYGESLGSGVATQMAYELAQRQTPVAGLVLEAPYTSIARRAQEMYPFIPAAFLARDKYHSIDKIDAIGCPLLLFHGGRDTVIPIEHGRALLEKAQEPKQGIFFDEVDHTSFDHRLLAQYLQQFAQNSVSTPTLLRPA